MKIRYELLFKSGAKEKVVQEATDEEHGGIMQIVSDSFQNDLNAVITFGDGKKAGRQVRVSDLSQVHTEILD